MIEKCAFGSMVIDGRTYTSDMMIFPDGRVVASWRRKAGHRLEIEDIGELVAAAPEIIVAGTGMFGLMRLKKDLTPVLNEQGIELVAIRTPSAVQEYNRFIQTPKRVAACFHLTC